MLKQRDPRLPDALQYEQPNDMDVNEIVVRPRATLV
jgi:hypothetical protein